PHSLAHAVGPVGLAAEAPAVAARHADALGRCQDAGSRDQPGADGVAHRERDSVYSAEVAHRRDAGLDRLLRAEDRLDRPERGRVLEQHTGRIGLAAEAEVDVTVDEPRKEREAREIQPRRGGRVAPDWDERLDPALLEPPRVLR